MKKLLPLAAAAALVSSACDNTDLGKVGTNVTAPAEIDFGDVLVGQTARKTIDVRNIGGGPARVTAVRPADDFDTATYKFGVSTSSFDVPAGGTASLEATFQPFDTSSTAVDSSFLILTDVDAGGGKLELRVIVKGRGVRDALSIVPNPLDFGTVLAGSSVERELTITNLLPDPVELFVRIGADGKPDFTINGSGDFEITSPVGANGALLPAGQKLGTGATTTVRARYFPHAVPDGTADRARLTFASCSDNLCDQIVDFIGRGTSTGIECTPPAIDFGEINPGRTLTQTITCTNISVEPLLLRGWMLAPGSADELTIPLYTGTPSMLAPMESFTIDATFAPTVASLDLGPRRAEVHIDAAPMIGPDLNRVRIPLEGTAGGPGIGVAPTSLAFGQVVVGTSSRQRILVSNVGYSPLLITGVTIPDAVFTTSAFPMTLDVGTSTIVEVYFSPAAEQPYMSVLSIASNDAIVPVFDVPLSGQGLALPPCVYTLMPTSLGFGVVEQGTSSVLSFQVRNDGAAACLMNLLELGPPSADFRLVNGLETGVLIPAGDVKDIPVEFAPMRNGAQTGFVTFYISDPTMTEVSVALAGTAQAPCGNGVLDPGEQCDDGNPFNGDACDANCTFPGCGNNIIDPGEYCDDGNLIDGDGCSSTCFPTGVCGNFNLEPGEQCDDGNLLSNDGCSPLCTLEPCGNGVIDPGEQCDDGNQIGGDGCSAACLFDIFQGVDVVSAGLGGVRGLGSGTIVLTGVSGTVTRALLFWHGPTNSVDFQANATISFNNTYVTGTNVGFSSDNCWSFLNSQAYRADVTSLVTGDGNYPVADLVKPSVDVNGISLVVFFDDGNAMNNYDVGIYDGNDSNIDSPYDPLNWNQTYQLSNFMLGQQAWFEFHVADGQTFPDDAVSINGQQLLASGQNFDGDSVPNSNGQLTDGLWDIRRHEITSLLTVGPQSLNVTSGVNSDCLSLVAMLLITTAP